MDFESLITFSDITISIITSRNPSFLRSKKEKKNVKATSIKTARRSKFSSSWSQITFSKRFESESYLRSRGIGRMGIGKDEVEGKRRGRKGIETGNGSGSIDCVARSEALPSHWWVDRWTHGYVLQVLAKSRPLPWSRRNASSAISSYRYRQSGGKGHHHFFYVPHSGHVEHCRGFCFPSLFRAPLIDVSIRVSSKLPPISPSTNYLMVNVRCYGTKFGTFFLVDFSYISLKSKERASVFGLIRAIYLKKCLAQIFEIVLKLNHPCVIR